MALCPHRGGSRSIEVRPCGGRPALPSRAGRGSQRRRIPAPEIADVHEARGDLLDRLGAYGEAADSYRAARGLVGGDPLAESKLYLKEAWISERLGHYSRGSMGHPGSSRFGRRRGHRSWQATGPARRLVRGDPPRAGSLRRGARVVPASDQGGRSVRRTRSAGPGLLHHGLGPRRPRRTGAGHEFTAGTRDLPRARHLDRPLPC